ncbi:MAG TPA: DNA adenine methylase [Candidatus Binatia bacterium]
MPPRLNQVDLEEGLLQTPWCLSRVTIEDLAYQDVIRRYDRPHTFFYLDPPYFGMKVYRYNFEPKDFARLADVLDKIKGKFLMSIKHHSEVRRIFKALRIRAVGTKYSSMNGRVKGRSPLRREFLIRNYKLGCLTGPSKSRKIPVLLGV